MVEKLRIVIEELRERVNNNLDMIHENEKKVRRLLRETVSEQRSSNLEKIYEENKKMLKENHESIQLQLQINKFIESNRALLETKEKNQKPENVEEISHRKELSPVEYWDMTISGEIPFDQDHPYFENEEFFKSLLSYFTKIEDYEKCDWLVKQRTQKNIR